MAIITRFLFYNTLILATIPNIGTTVQETSDFIFHNICEEVYKFNVDTTNFNRSSRNFKIAKFFF